MVTHYFKLLLRPWFIFYVRWFRLSCAAFADSPSQFLELLGWLVGLGLGTLSSCGRATYVFSPSPHAYLATEQPAPSVPMLAVPLPSAVANSLRPSANQHLSSPARRPVTARKTHPSAAARQMSGLGWANPSTLLLVTKHLAKPLTAPHVVTHRVSSSSPSNKLATSLCLIGAGAIALIIGSGIGSIFLVGLLSPFFLIVGGVAVAVGIVLLLAAFNTKE